MSRNRSVLRLSANAAAGAVVTKETIMPKDELIKSPRRASSEVAATLAHPTSQAMLNRDIARLAYVTKDGEPRVVPIAFTWNGAEVVMCTPPNGPKLASLRRNPKVALTIDTEAHPPTILL